MLPRMAASQSSALTKLTDTLSLLTGVGTNVLALSTSDGMVLVDSGAPQYGAALMDATSRVRTVFNTHFHLENTGSNENLAQAGAKILAHEHTREWMATPYWIPGQDRYEKARPKAAHPTETFYTSGSLMAGGEQIDYSYLIEAHTSGDIYVFFRNSNVLAVGDVVSPVRDPELDYFTGAWIGGRIDAMDRLLKLSDDKTVHARVYFGLARIAVLQKNPDLAEQLFRKTLELSPDPHTQSWTEVFLGRMYENTDTPQNALEHYRSALAVNGAPPGARQAAEQGIRKLETNK